MKYTKTKTSLSTTIAAAAALIAAPLMSAGDNTKHMDSKEKNYALRATSIEGMNLLDKNGGDVGNIDDFVISTETGEIESYVVGTGFLGFGGPTRTISVDQLDDSGLTSSSVKTTLSKKDFDRSPVFSEQSLSQERKGDDRIRSGQFQAMDFVYSDLETADGDHLGEVIDWIVDIQNDNVPYMIVRQRNPVAYTSGYDYFAISTDTLSGVRSGDLVATIDESDLDNASDLDSSNALTLDDDSSIFRFSYTPEDTEVSMK